MAAKKKKTEAGKPERESIRIRPEVHAELSAYCKQEGMLIGVLAGKLITEGLAARRKA